MDANAAENDVDEAPKAEACAPEFTTSIMSHTPLLGRVLTDGHIALRSQQPTTTFASLDDSFCTQLAKWLTNELAANNISLPCPVQFNPGDQVSFSRTI